MSPETLEALRGSIAKWKAIVQGTGIDDGADNCPLCGLFNVEDRDDDTQCLGCPVREKTGKPFCIGSPYSRYYFSASKTHAAAELDFLISLLPEGEKP